MSVLVADGWPGLLLAGALSFAEAALGLGVVLPGEVAIVALTSTFAENAMMTAVLVVTLGATLGDHVGYVIGRRTGPRLTRSRLIERLGHERWARATELTRRHGVPALLVSRMLPFIRTLMPAAAGVARVGYGRFVLASVVGSFGWAFFWVGAGGAVSATGILANPVVLAAVLLVVGAGLATAVVRRRRSTALS